MHQAVESATTKGIGYFESVQLLRGFAAMLVLFEHSFQSAYFWNMPWFDEETLDLGQLGVSVFFVISGFVLPLSLQKAYQLADYPRFLLRRMVRIEPTYIASMLVAIAWVWLATRLAPNAVPWQIDLGQIAAHLLYLIPFTNYNRINQVYWTLAIEFQFYFFIGLIFTLLRASANRSVWLAAMLITIFAASTFAAPLWRPLQLMTCAPFFAMGMLAWLVTCYTVGSAVIAVSICILLAVGLLGGLSLANLVFGVVGLLLICFWEPRRMWWRFFGTISYSLYVVHFPITSLEYMVGRRLLAAGYESWLFPLPFVTMALCIAAAWVLYKLVEEPTMRLSKRIKYASRS